MNVVMEAERRVISRIRCVWVGCVYCECDEADEKEGPRPIAQYLSGRNTSTASARRGAMYVKLCLSLVHGGACSASGSA